MIKVYIRLFQLRGQAKPYVYTAFERESCEMSIPDSWVALTETYEANVVELPKEEVVPKIIEQLEAKKKELLDEYTKEVGKLNSMKSELLMLAAPSAKINADDSIEGSVADKLQDSEDFGDDIPF